MPNIDFTPTTMGHINNIMDQVNKNLPRSGEVYEFQYPIMIPMLSAELMEVLPVFKTLNRRVKRADNGEYIVEKYAVEFEEREAKIVEGGKLINVKVTKLEL